MIADHFQHLAGWLAEPEAQRAVEVLAAELPWTQPTVTVFGRSYLTPRLVCPIGASYGYSGQRHADAPWHPLVAELCYEVERQARASFNSALANMYRDGRDSIGWHADDEPELGPEPVIASLSLGTARTFSVKARQGDERASFELRTGDLVIMRGRAQADYLHSVPRRVRRSHRAATRINLTFRMVG